MTKQILKKSKYLQIIERLDKTYLAYHTLYGNLRYLNYDALNLLNVLDSPMSQEEYNAIYTQYSSYIQHFADIYYLVEPGYDERTEVGKELIEREKTLTKGAFIGGIQLNVSDTCNFKCNYCFCDFVDKRSEKRIEISANKAKLMQFATAEMTINTLIRIVKDSKRNQLVIKFFGREPLTNWPLMKKVMEHYGHGEAFGVNIYYALTSNGTLVTPEIAKTLARFGVKTTVSIDGLEDSNNHVRISKTGTATFPEIKAGIECLAREGAIDVISAVITNENFDTFDTRFVDFAHKHNIKEIQILLGMQGEFINKIDPEKISQKLFDIYRYGKNLGVNITGYWYNSIIEVFSTRKLRGELKTTHGIVESCTATGYQISVEPSGDIFPCRAMSMHTGHMSEFDKFLNSDWYKHVVMRTYLNVKDCRNCIIEGFCQGECIGNLEEKYGDIYKVDENYCKIYRNIARKVLASM